ncbi:MarR family transcriptional regulator [Nonomuraea phyllanthi]|uniref:MarR family transcriptional regulator n=1 Tax=Nonomuraea phyllanthi TaxID=2219224 RepID=A0A5C4VXB3_9ACTN|nr:MarR family transcriptional regulator [Nonomuraea phyllanthi]KAB8190493.1 MarR family transcriptional regulator [Nonomuraea phyllanthi]QFY05679.1 MarR family transcriptional regulator [Nonomuraea phyllanthi]
MSEQYSIGEPFLPQLIGQTFNLVLDGLLQRLVENGYDDLRPTHYLNVFRLLDCDGTRPTTLARKAGMTPQAMSELVGHLEQHGYVRRVRDPADGRGRIVVFADRGTRAAEISAGYFAELEVRWADVVGADGLQAVRSSLTQILADLPARRTAIGGGD